MNARKWFYTVSTIVILGALGTSSAGASFSKHTNHITFSGPVRLPGVTLPAGTYTFELPIPDSDLDIVQVSSRNGREVYYTGFTKLIERPGSMPMSQLIAFGEAPTNTAPPIAAWFPLNERTGRQFDGPARRSRHAATMVSGMALAFQHLRGCKVQGARCRVRTAIRNGAPRSDPAWRRGRREPCRRRGRCWRRSPGPARKTKKGGKTDWEPGDEVNADTDAAAQEDAENAADGREHRGLSEELKEHFAAARAQRTADADLPRALRH